MTRQILLAKTHKHQRYSPRGLFHNCCFYITHPTYIQHIFGNSMCVHIAVIKKTFESVYFQSLTTEVQQT